MGGEQFGSPARHRTTVRFRHHLPPVGGGGALREVRASHPTAQIRVVVDDHSLWRFGDHVRVAQEPEPAIKWLAAKLTTAECEVAVTKSKVLSNSTLRATKGCRCGSRRSGCRRQGRNETLASISRRESELPLLCDGRGWKKTNCRVKRIRKIHWRSSVPLRQRLAMIAWPVVAKATHHGDSVTGLNETQLQPCSLEAWYLAKRLHRWCWWQPASMTQRTTTSHTWWRHRARCGTNDDDQVHQGRSARTAAPRAALARREGAIRCGGGNFETQAVKPPVSLVHA